jgi:hypothetical protein
MNKCCSRCKKEKPLDSFSNNINMKDGKGTWCKLCMKDYRKNRLKTNGEEIRKKDRERYALNPEPKKNYANKYRKENPEKIQAWQEANKELRRAYNNNWRKENRNRWLEKSNSYYNNKYHTDSKYKVRVCISRGINQSLREGKGGNWEGLVGYSTIELIEHLEKQFKPGMDWSNYGKYGWHIDHIIPISSFEFSSTEDIDFKLCWSLKNLQPLWAEDNLRKGNKLDSDEILSKRGTVSF